MASFIVRLLPVLLAAASWLIGWALIDVLTSRSAMLWALLPTGLLVLLRGLLEFVAPPFRDWAQDSRVPPARPALVPIWLVVHTAVLMWALVLNPLSCAYAFVGYLDASRLLRGRWQAPLVVVTALLLAFGQGGGMLSFTRPTLFIGLAVVNLVISAGMLHMSAAHEREVDAREAAAIELERVTRENAELHDELIDRARAGGVATERARLSREIHDTVAQGLLGVIHQLEAVPDGLDAEARARISRAEEAARESLLEARRAVRALSPQQLEDADLVRALHEVTAQWARSHRIVTTFDSDDAPGRPAHGPVLLRVAQEALANTARHARAASVTLRLSEVQGRTVLEVCDDGLGFDPDHVVRGHGLDNMATRVREVGGDLQVRSRPGRGCRITAEVPAQRAVQAGGS